MLETVEGCIDEDASDPPCMCMSKVSEMDGTYISSLTDIDFGEVSPPIQALVMPEWVDYPPCRLGKLEQLEPIEEHDLTFQGLICFRKELKAGR